MDKSGALDYINQMFPTGLFNFGLLNFVVFKFRVYWGYFGPDIVDNKSLCKLKLL